MDNACTTTGADPTPTSDGKIGRWVPARATLLLVMVLGAGGCGSSAAQPTVTPRAAATRAASPSLVPPAATAIVPGTSMHLAGDVLQPAEMPGGFTVIRAATGPRPLSSLHGALRPGLQGMFGAGYVKGGAKAVYDYALKYGSAATAAAALRVLRLSIQQQGALHFGIPSGLGQQWYGWHVTTPAGQGSSLPTTYIAWRSGDILAYIYTLGSNRLSDAAMIRLAKRAEANIRAS